MKLFGKKKDQSCCTIKIEEVKTDNQKTSSCCSSAKTAKETKSVK
ncbi:hypothetical protein [Sporolactobacillus shoreae]|nr:hypothetical protein [Sporolactobacillus shoreae]